MCRGGEGGFITHCLGLSEVRYRGLCRGGGGMRGDLSLIGLGYLRTGIGVCV